MEATSQDGAILTITWLVVIKRCTDGLLNESDGKTIRCFMFRKQLVGSELVLSSPTLSNTLPPCCGSSKKLPQWHRSMNLRRSSTSIVFVFFSSMTSVKTWASLYDDHLHVTHFFAIHIFHVNSETSILVCKY